jgi:hypothetical protein
MAKRYYNLEKETKEYLKACEVRGFSLPVNITAVNDNIIKRKAVGKDCTFLYNTPIVFDGLSLLLDTSIPGSVAGSSWLNFIEGGNNGTIIGNPVLINGAFDITGDSTYISISNIGLVPRTNDFTYSCWVNFDAFNSLSTIFENGSWTDTLLFRHQSNTAIYVYSEGALRGTFSWTGTAGVWYNIILRRESNTTSCFINSVLTGTPFTMNLDINLANTNIFLMRSQHTTNQFTNGKIASFSIYNRALSQTEITQNFNVTKGRFGL